MRDRIFYSICFGFVVGVLVRSCVFINIFFALFLSVIALTIILIFSLISKNKKAIFTGVFVLAFSLGVLRFGVVDKPAPYAFESQVGSEVSLLGIVIDEPDIREDNQKLTIETKIEEQSTKILTTVDLAGYFKYGDEVRIEGVLKKPENFLTDQGKEFDYVNYLKKDEILYIMGYPEVEILSSGHGSPLKRILFSIKNIFLNKINMAVPHPESLLLGGLILGERSSFGDEMRQKFIDTGTIHIVALSGYNVTIVAEWITKMFSFLPHGLGLGAGILGILLFVIMAGGQSTAVRAGVMASLAIFARATGRNYDVARALILAGVIMILSNPMILVHDVSFQLSFIATIAVIFVSPRVEKYFLWVPTKFKLRDVVSVTFSAYIFVLPFILYKMGNLSLVALPANILVLPFIPVTMIFGFLTGFLGIISYLLAVPTGYISYFLLHYELGVIDILSKVPFASITIPDFPLVLVLIIYAYFFYRLFGKNIKNFFKNEAS